MGVELGPVRMMAYGDEAARRAVPARVAWEQNQRIWHILESLDIPSLSERAEWGGLSKHCYHD